MYFFNYKNPFTNKLLKYANITLSFPFIIYKYSEVNLNGTFYMFKFPGVFENINPKSI